MVDYERTVEVAAAPDDAFRTLSDPSELPRYVATMTTAEPGTDDRIRVAADVQGRHEEGEARFTVDGSARRMEWSGEAATGYRGSLEVSAAGTGSSVTIRLEGVRDDDRAEVERALDGTVANIERLLAAVTDR